jgi:hypothetical protein
VQAAAVNAGLFTAYFALLELAYFKRDQHVVITAGGEDVQEAILDLTEGLGAEVIYDAVAAPDSKSLCGQRSVESSLDWMNMRPRIATWRRMIKSVRLPLL